MLERATFTIALGLGLWALTLFVLGVTGTLSRWLIATLTVVVAAITLLSGLRDARARLWDRAPAARQKEHRHGIGRALIVATGVGVWACLWLWTLYPPLEWDGISHHLVLARNYLEDQRLGVQLGIPYPILPALHHMLFVWALAIADDVLAQMVEHVFLMLTVLGLIAWGQRRGRPLLGAAAGAFLIAHPLLVWLSGTAYVDLGVMACAFLGIYALRVFWDEGDASWWTLGMALLAMAASVKLPGAVFLGPAVALGVWKFAGLRTGLDSPGVTWWPLARGLLVALVVAAPWYGFIAYHTGNPVWPVLPQISQGIWGSPRVVADAHAMFWAGHVERTMWSYVTFPVDFVLNESPLTPEVSPAVFPLLMAWPLAWIVSFRDRSVRWWTLWALWYTVFWFQGLEVLRYWSPALPLAGVALYESLQWVGERVWKSPAWQNALWSILIVLSLGWSGQWLVSTLRPLGWPPVDSPAREEFLDTFSLGYRAATYINDRAQPDEKVYVVGASWLNYYLRPRVIDYVGVLEHDNWPVFGWPADERWMRSLDERQVSWILVNRVHGPLSTRLQAMNPSGRQIWPDFRLVYDDGGMWVFRRTAPGQAAEEPRGPASVADRSPPAILEGYHDVTNCNGILAWAWDMNRKDEPIRLDVYDGGVLLGSVTADLFREDLMAAGKGNGRHGAFFPVLPQLKDGRTHIIRVRFAGTDVDLLNGPKEIRCGGV